MGCLKNAVLPAFVLVIFTVCVADMVVQLNINRPFNDVNEKFVSFAIKPDDLYKALDGPQRKSITRMAALMGNSYVKFLGDFYFATHSPFKLRNPTNIIWKGFNRWTRAINWTMIIPVPYSSNSWDPMFALSILNNSHILGISECIWQLGNDFGSSNIKDYIQELTTLNLMVESFKPFVDDWKLMGADIPAGSSIEDIQHYVQLSKSFNVAFGLTPQCDELSSRGIISTFAESDVFLKTLLSNKVPVWLNLPSLPKKLQNVNSESFDGLHWAQTLGDAASSGFDAVFKTLSIADFENSDFSFFITVIFKKVMGSRVFPARSMNHFVHNCKLYTHCAVDASGGITFMGVNKADTTLDISVKLSSMPTNTEVWKFVLTATKYAVLLNNEKLSPSSSLEPQKTIIDPQSNVSLSLPRKSVSFWVLPNINLEHCQYTEIVDHKIDKQTAAKRYTSSDKLLKKFIQETSVAHSPLASIINRKRRHTNLQQRENRFFLWNRKKNYFRMNNIPNSIPSDKKTLLNRDKGLKQRPRTYLKWIVDDPMISKNNLHKRGKRSTDKYFQSFSTKTDVKKTPFTKKITEIKKPERKVKQFFDLDEFDEEEFFKTVSEHREPEYTRLPEGDVHLKLITNIDGDEVEEYTEEIRKASKKSTSTKYLDDFTDTVSEIKPIRLLTTELYEPLPNHLLRTKIETANSGTLNSLLFPEPFSRRDQNESRETVDIRDKNCVQQSLNSQTGIKKSYTSENRGKSIFDHVVKPKHSSHDERKAGSYNQDLMTLHIGDYFNTNEEIGEKKVESIATQTKELNEMPWWKSLSEFNKKRFRRALEVEVPDESWQANLITKENEFSHTKFPEQIGMYESNVFSAKKRTDDIEEKLPQTLVSNVKGKVAKFMDLLAHHISELYSTILQQMEATLVDTSTINKVN